MSKSAHSNGYQTLFNGLVAKGWPLKINGRHKGNTPDCTVRWKNKAFGQWLMTASEYCEPGINGSDRSFTPTNSKNAARPNPRSNVKPAVRPTKASGLSESDFVFCELEISGDGINADRAKYGDRIAQQLDTWRVYIRWGIGIVAPIGGANQHVLDTVFD